MTDAPQFVLASGSPRRSLLLSAAGYTFSVSPPEIVEVHLQDEEPAEMVLRLSAAKAAAVADEGAVVLAADTVVVRDGMIIGKPADADEAVAILESLSGRVHSVLTGWTVRQREQERFGITESRVVFAARSRDELVDYVARTEPFDKAGAYALQGDDGWLVVEVKGSRSNVMGLPLTDIAEALAAFGVERSTPKR
ncbi:MAG: Maf family protein [Acidimicrobiia bacterium]|nr:Maf family protein [Acidimicrobiia bacterium]